jgi:hypothetical protein
MAVASFAEYVIRDDQTSIYFESPLLDRSGSFFNMKLEFKKIIWRQ